MPPLFGLFWLVVAVALIWHILRLASVSGQLDIRCLLALIISILGRHNLLRAVSRAVLLAVLLSRRVLTAPAAPGKKSGGSSRG
jgi:hypothetical protein